MSVDLKYLDDLTKLSGHLIDVHTRDMSNDHIRAMSLHVDIERLKIDRKRLVAQSTFYWVSSLLMIVFVVGCIK